MKNVTGVAIIGVLSALAVTGWMQRPAQVASAATVAATYAPVGQQPLYPQEAMAQIPAAGYMAQPSAVSPVARVQTVADRRYENRTDRYRDPYRRRDDRYERSDRPFSHSAAIVGGSAAAGAAIGGLAKGGKGAAVGALAGGAAGLIYDRMTHKNTRW